MPSANDRYLAHSGRPLQRDSHSWNPRVPSGARRPPQLRAPALAAERAKAMVGGGSWAEKRTTLGKLDTFVALTVPAMCPLACCAASGEAVPPRPVSARPTIASSAANSHAPQVRQGLAQESRTSIVLRTVPTPPPPTEKKVVLPAMPSAPPPSTGSNVVLRAAHRSPPSPTEKKVVLPPMPSPPPPATASNVVLRAAHRSPPSPTEKKVVQRAMRSPPRPATAVRISSGRSSVGSVDATIRRQASEQYFDYRRSVLRALLASKSWTRTGINNSKGSRR